MYNQTNIVNFEEELIITNPKQLIELSSAMQHYFNEVLLNNKTPKNAYKKTLEQFPLDSETNTELERAFKRSESGFNAINLLQELTKEDAAKTFEIIYNQTPPRELEVAYTPLNINLYLPESFFNIQKGELGIASAHNGFDTHKECSKFLRNWKKSRKLSGDISGLVAKINPIGISNNIPQNLSTEQQLFLSLTGTFIDDSRVLLHELGHVLEHYMGSNIDYSSELFAHMYSEVSPFKESFQRAAREDYESRIQKSKQILEEVTASKYCPKVLLKNIESNLSNKQEMFDQVYYLDPSLIERIKKLGHDQEKIAFLIPYIPTMHLKETLNEIKEYLEF